MRVGFPSFVRSRAQWVLGGDFSMSMRPVVGFNGVFHVRDPGRREVHPRLPSTKCRPASSVAAFPLSRSLWFPFLNDVITSI